MKRNELLRSIIIMATIVAITVGAAFGLNFLTGPVIEEKRAAAASGILAEVLPDAGAFAEITTDLTIDSASGVTAVHESKDGKGYVFFASAAGFSKPVTVIVGVTSDGKIAGLKVEVGEGDWKVEDNIQASYIGQDSTLSGVIKGGASFSEKGVKDAVAAGFKVLAENGLMKAAAKEIEQVFEELLPTVSSGLFKGTDLTPAGNIYAAYITKNENVVVAYVNKGEEKLLVLHSLFNTTVYKANLLDANTQKYELVDVTNANNDVVSEVTTFAASKLSSSFSKLSKKLGKMFDGATDITEINVSTYSCVVSAASFKHEGKTYYGYFAKTHSYENEIMNIYVVLDEQGKICDADLTKFFFHDEHFADKPQFDKDSYLTGLNDLNGTSFDGSQTLISGATMSSNGMKQAISDVFALFATQGGNN